jgi:ubiquinone biosynthesis UbiH/UbiF/VisC/COQ6 family hydroxylase
MMPPNASCDTDVLIVGAGPAGLALACSLADAGIRSIVLEQAPLSTLVSPPEDGRDIALTHRARRILTSLGLWGRLPADEVAPLKAAHVTSGTSPWVLPFEAKDEGFEALGWLVPNHRIREACYAGAQDRPDWITLQGDAQVTALQRTEAQARVTLADGRTLSARLLVAADSRFSTVRKMAGIGARLLDFGRTAIVCRMQHERDHEGVAHECFLSGHTLAILPMAGHQASAVWTVSTDGATDIMLMSDEDFAQAVAGEFNHRLGTMQTAGARHAYPLVAVYAQRFWADRFALIGDAAVGMHPVTAHGYNFGLYGIETLTRELLAARGAGRELGDAQALRAYSSEHRRVTLPIYEGTNAIVKLFTTNLPAAHLVRGAILRVSRYLPPLKSAITNQLTGNGHLPLSRLLRHLPSPRV